MALSPFLVSFSAVGLAEIGDKTQLLAMMLAARTKRPLVVIAGIFLATLLNNMVAAAVGTAVTHALGPEMLRWIVGLGLIGMAVWMLLPEKEEKPHISKSHFGVLVVAFVSFFLAELGDKTQIATLALAARYAGDYWMVVAGTTLGMMAVNIPAVWMGEKILRKMPMRAVHVAAAAIYLVTGVLTLINHTSFLISPAS